MIFNKASLPDLSINETNTLFHKYLTYLYDKVDRNYLAKNLEQNSILETYGEILYPGVDKFLAQIKLTEHDIFVDLGSGKGQIAAQVFLKSLVQKAYGIEIVPQLHQKAVEAARLLQHELPNLYDKDRQLSFLWGSFLEIPFQDATVALINSTCFTQNLLNKLGLILENNPNIHTVFSLRPIGSLQRLMFKGTIRVECSWDSALGYIYCSGE